MDVTEAVTQDQIADSLISEPEGQPTETAPGTETVDEQQGEEQVVEQTEGEQEQVEDADYLPTEQEKVFPAEVIARYAQRYGFTQQMIDANPSLLNVLHDKINTDIYVRQLNERQQQEELEREQQQTQQVEQRPTPQQQPVPFTQWQSNAREFIKQNGLLNPEVAKSFSQMFMGAFGLQEKDYPQGFNSEAFTEPFVLFGMNLINSLLPLYFQAPSQNEGQNMFQYLTESNYQGLGDLASTSAYRSAWNSVRSSFPDLAKLGYGSDEFSDMMERAEQAMPGLQWQKFADQNGRPLSAKANAERQYQIAARLVLGQKLSPELTREAVQTGQRLARQSQVRRQAGNLGAGNSKQQFSQQTDDEFWSNPASWNNYLDRKL